MAQQKQRGGGWWLFPSYSNLPTPNEGCGLAPQPKEVRFTQLFITLFFFDTIHCPSLLLSKSWRHHGTSQQAQHVSCFQSLLFKAWLMCLLKHNLCVVFMIKILHASELIVNAKPNVSVFKQFIQCLTQLLPLADAWLHLCPHCRSSHSMIGVTSFHFNCQGQTPFQQPKGQFSVYKL